MAVLGGVLAGVLLIAAIILVPIAVIWALNTLFALGIVLTVKTWLAALVLSSIIYGSSGSSSQS